jgi:hypothetical protein
MKKLLIILGSIFLIIILVVAVGIGIVAVKGTAFDKESKAYVDSTVPMLVAAWDEKELLSRASPEFTQAVKDEELDKLYGMFRRLGKLREYQGSEGQSNMSVNSWSGRVVSAAYTARASFDAGPAVIKIALIKHGDNWQIYGFHIDSEVFLQHE